VIGKTPEIMVINTKGIQNIILDLGGVVVDLAPGLTLERFASLGFTGHESLEKVMAEYPVFEDYETGRISTDDFLTSIQEIKGRDISHEEIIWAWNTMILEPRKEIFNLLQALKGHFRLYLLSNTSELHIHSLNERLIARHGINGLEEVFDRVYYSYKLGMRKPDMEIFEFVLKDAGISPAETLYIDDSSIHLESAGKLGIKVYHIEPPERLTDILHI
jgi:putative hydrolase of the HAD superfamily